MGDSTSVRVAVRDGSSLEARLRGREGPVAIIAPPHPLHGGSIGNPVVRALETAFQRASVATLAFNFRGVDESDGEPTGRIDDALEDYLAAARSVQDRGLLWLSGYSFGAITALRAAARLGIERVLLVAPPVAMLDLDDVRAHRGTLHVVTGTEDAYGPPDELANALEEHENAPLHAIQGADHFFFGSAVTRLAETLSAIVRA